MPATVIYLRLSVERDDGKDDEVLSRYVQLRHDDDDSVVALARVLTAILDAS